ncbi:MAG TPA: cob(I)yrinic acid a,c-diamide adenosyltransferase [Acidimicrobiia bacterium]
MEARTAGRDAGTESTVVTAPKIYTRKGDDGSTGLLYGGRVGKDSPGPDAYGAVDEAVSALGLARAETERGSELDELVVRLQRELFVVGAELATSPDKRDKLTPEVSLTTEAMVTALEPVIDDVTARYDPPTEFVLPGENRVAAALDVARTVVRRAERQAVAAAHAGWLDGSFVVAYLNRLADLVYTLARWQEGTFRPVRTSNSRSGDTRSGRPDPR